MRSVAGSFVLLAATALALPAQPAPGSVDTDFFETKIRPLFAEKCFACHTEARSGGLQLDSREHFLKGGKSGPVAVPGDPNASLLVKALRYDANPKMPPSGKLAAGQVAAVEAWVKAGAVWPQDGKAAPKSPPYKITAEQRAFWSFQPVQPATPPDVKDADWGRTEIDRFIAAKLEARGLHPVRRADRRTLIRRATYDLTGLPPTAEEVAAFEQDRSPDAFAEVVDRLLASPRYGERWGRIWLDVARYSDDRLDSEHDDPYPASYRYRDWVIQAIQSDMPYDVFVKAQIAGDQLPDREKYEAGLGFYALSPEMQDERVDATSRAFLGLTVACAQCHDHKYDPIPTRDFYSLMGIFRNTELHEVPLAAKETVDVYKAQEDLIRKKEKELKEYVDAQSAQLGLILASETARYVLASGDSWSEVTDTPPGPSLDRETLARWTKYLADPEKQHPFLKDWYAARTPDQRAQAATEFQAQVVGVIAEKAHVDDENHIRLGLDPSRDDLSKANLVSLDRARFGLWEDMLGEHGILLYGDSKKEDGRIDRFLAGVWLDRLTQLRAQVAALKKDLPPAYPVLQTIVDKEKPEEQHVWIRGDQNNPGEAAPPHFLAILSPAEPETLRARQRAPGTRRSYRQPCQSADRSRYGQSRLAAALRVRPGAHAEQLRRAGRPPLASRTARLSRRPVCARRLVTQETASRDDADRRLWVERCALPPQLCRRPRQPPALAIQSPPPGRRIAPRFHPVRFGQARFAGRRPGRPARQRKQPPHGLRLHFAPPARSDAGAVRFSESEQHQ
jgi:mono/diheme cytochrome c family protein